MHCSGVASEGYVYTTNFILSIVDGELCWELFEMHTSKSIGMGINGTSAKAMCLEVNNSRRTSNPGWQEQQDLAKHN